MTAGMRAMGAPGTQMAPFTSRVIWHGSVGDDAPPDRNLLALTNIRPRPLPSVRRRSVGPMIALPRALDKSQKETMRTISLIRNDGIELIWGPVTVRGGRVTAPSRSVIEL